MTIPAMRIPPGMKTNSQIVVRGRGISGLYRLPVKANHRGYKINVQHFVYDRLVQAGKEFNSDWRNLRWSIAKDMTVHVYPPDVITIKGEINE